MRAIWESYAGWFRHRSTTELHPVPPGRIHADLAELVGGAAPLAELTRAKLAAGAPVEAIHRVEAALAADPRHVGALQASLAAQGDRTARGGARGGLLSPPRPSAVPAPVQ